MYDGLNVVQELNGATPTANLLTSLGIDETLLRTDAVGARSFLADGLGSTLALTDAAGLVQSEYTYEPFGKTTVTGTASTNAFKYTGREDDGTGLYYYRARYYHPVLQRFVAQDPIGFGGGDVNLYAYVFNNPVSFTDSVGLWTFSVGSTIGGAIGGVGGGGGTFINIGHNPNAGWTTGWSFSITGTVVGGAVAGFGGGVGITVTGSNACDVSQLPGPFYEAGKGGLGPLGLGYFQSPDGSVKGGGVTVGLAGTGYMGASAGVSDTSSIVQWVQ